MGSALEQAVEDGLGEIGRTWPRAARGLLVVTIVERRFRWRMLTTRKSTLAASAA